MAGLPGPGDLVVVVGWGVTGRSVAQVLARRGCRVLVTADGKRPKLADLATVPPESAGDFEWVRSVKTTADLTELPTDAALVVVSPGVPPTSPVRLSAARASVEVIGEVELAWRIEHDRRGDRPQTGSAAGARLAQGPVAGARPWLAVTGTNGKTTTIGMLQSILRAAGRHVTACGNVGWPVVDAVTAARQDVIAAELSSFQLHDAPSLHLTAGAVLNVAPDHLDWYGGSMAAYAADKARALTGEVAVAVVDDPGAAALLADASAPRRVPVTAGEPPDGGLGIVDGNLVDRAFGAGTLLPVSDLQRAGDLAPTGRHNVTNALTAAALALAAGVDATAVAAGLRAFQPGEHRNLVIDQVDGVWFVDDSKATNPHAAAASMAAYPRLVWIAGGQLKGAEIDGLVEQFADRLAGVVVLGADAPLILAALGRHAPDVPQMHVPGTDDGVMTEVVGAAMAMARAAGPADAVTSAGPHESIRPVVLLAPAAASLDMFPSYAHRGRAFAAAVHALPAREKPGLR